MGTLHLFVEGGSFTLCNTSMFESSLLQLHRRVFLHRVPMSVVQYGVIPLMLFFRQIVSELSGSRDQSKPFKDPGTSSAGQCSPPLFYPVYGITQNGTLGEVLVRG